MSLENVTCPHCDSRSLMPTYDLLGILKATCMLCSREFDTSVGRREERRRAAAAAETEYSIRSLSYLRKQHLAVLDAVGRRSSGATIKQIAQRTNTPEEKLCYPLRYVMEKGLVEQHGKYYMLTSQGEEAVA